MGVQTGGLVERVFLRLQFVNTLAL